MTVATRALEISPQLGLPLEAVTETFGILAVKRAGKSNAAVVLAEEMYYAGLPWVAIDPKGDWWGVRSSADGEGPGLPILVFGGLHGDVPLEPTAGHLVADLVVDQRLTCVIDVSEMSKADQRRFLADFAERLYKRNREPLHVFCEEADEYIPQMVRGDAARLVGAFETLVKRGGFRGLGVTLITQRSASLNKDVLTQVQTLFAMRTTSPQDRKAILGWVVQHALGEQMVEELPGLDDGEAWMFSPHWLQLLEKIRFRRRRTFDSGATPKVGVKARPPVRLAEVDIAALRERMASTIEKAKAEDPKELRRRIAQLERDLAADRRSHEAQLTRLQKELLDRESIVVEVPTYPEKVREYFRDMAAQLSANGTSLLELSKMVRSAAEAKLDPSGEQRVHRAASARVDRAGAGELTSGSSPAASSPTAKAPSALRSDGDFRPGKGEQKVLAVLAQWPDGRTHNELAFLAGYSAKASTLGVILSNLRRAGLVEPGQPIRATGEGLAAAGGVQELPSGPDLLNHWLSHPRMGEGERKVLRALIDQWPNVPTHDELCELTGYSPGASTMGVILSKLRKLGLVESGIRRIPQSFMEAIT